MVYADSGFLVSTYVTEQTSSEADAVVAAANERVFLTPLTELEMRNAFQRMMFRLRLTAAERDAAWAAVLEDVAAGELVRVSLEEGSLISKARELTDKHTPTVGTRTLDLLHVAAALLLGARSFGVSMNGSAGPHRRRD